MLNRVIASAFVVSAVGLAGMVACGSSSNPAKADAPKSTKEDAPKVFLDGSGSGVAIDAPGSAGPNFLGSACTSTCPSGFTCLVNGNDPGFCAQQCDVNADTCNDGFAGPGVGACILEVTFGSGSAGSAESFCGIVCGGEACEGSSACTGACPNGLDCSLTLTDQGGSAVGSACD